MGTEKHDVPDSILARVSKVAGQRALRPRVVAQRAVRGDEGVVDRVQLGPGFREAYP